MARVHHSPCHEHHSTLKKAAESKVRQEKEDEAAKATEYPYPYPVISVLLPSAGLNSRGYSTYLT